MSSELPAWFYGLKGLGLPGYALKQSSSLAMAGGKQRYYFYVTKNAAVLPLIAARLIEFE